MKLINLSMLFLAGLFTYGCGLSTKTKGTQDDTCEIQAKKDVTPGKIYDIKSGMFTFENKGAKFTRITNAYFDDYGKKFALVVETKGELLGNYVNEQKVKLFTDSAVYAYTIGNKEGKKMKPSYVKRFNSRYGELTDEQKKSINFKELPDEKFLGKTCKVYSMSEEGVTLTVWVWKNIMIKSVSRFKGNTREEAVVSIKENPKIPEGMFDIPKDVKFKAISDYGKRVRPK